MTRWNVLILALVAVAGLSGCVDRQAQTEAARTKTALSNPVIPVQVETVKQTAFVESLEITGSLTSSEDATVGARVAGRITRMLVKEGDPVTAGQLIGMQDTTNARIQLSQAQSQVDAAMAQVRQAQSDAAVAPTRSIAAVRAARAQLASAEAQLLKARNGARTEERRQADAQLNAARTNMEIAKKDLDRGERLLKEGAISERDYDRFRQQYASALAQYENALEATRIVQNATRQEDIQTLQSNVQAAREQLQTALANQRLDVTFRDRVDQARAQLRSAQQQADLASQLVADAEIRAPFAGRVAGKPLQVGSFAGPGTPIVRIVGQGGIYFEAEVPEVQVTKLRTGMPVQIVVDALNGRMFPGVIAAVSPQAESLGRLFKVRVMIEGFPTELKAGMFVQGKVETSRREGAITVPAPTIRRTAAGEPFVFVVQEGKAVRRIVTLGSTQAGRVEVQGLSVNDLVVTEGQTKVQDGTPVALDTQEGK